VALVTRPDPGSMTSTVHANYEFPVIHIGYPQSRHSRARIVLPAQQDARTCNTLPVMGGLCNTGRNTRYLPFRPSAEGLAWIDGETTRLQVTRSAVVRAALATFAALPEAERDRALTGQSEPARPSPVPVPAAQVRPASVPQCTHRTPCAYGCDE
jgi:hypothetical protein